MLGEDLPAGIDAVGPHIGVQTDTALYDRLTGLEDLTFFGRLYGMDAAHPTSAARAVLERFGLGDRQADRVGTYSKGMKQKTLIARALIADPELIFLDEPIAGLDPAGTGSARAGPGHGVRDSSRWTLRRRAYTAGSAGTSPSMCANLKKHQTLPSIDTTEESIRPRSPRLWMYSST